ncbi:hypothetical protein CI109_101340 [Kwoniella shandongensis]|uniref:Uncharacterized protein n=1 Tax=Kwoniella shandongensis TaxID=1734106 RepID=A0AAJ8LE36_9TREE
MSVTRPLAADKNHDPLPVDIVLRIAQHLVDNELIGTLASVQRCSTDLYYALSPLVYRRVDIRHSRSDALLTLDSSMSGEIEALETKIEEATQSRRYFSSSNSTLRHLNALRQIRHLTIHQLPSSDTISTSFLDFASNASFSSSNILPNLDSVQILPDAVDSIRTFIPTSYDRVRNPPFLEALAKSSQPSKLCIAHRVVPSEEWEEHREISVLGQYQVVARLTQLREDGWWTNLKEFSVHDIVHQVLPSLQGCRNIYHFSSHLTSSTKFVSPGTKSTYIPGPPWSYRAWQLGTAIKNLFPSGSDGKSVLQNTSWTFVNYDGHILTKMVRDDDDDSGVGWGEVEGLIQDAVKAGLPQDLPMREGFGRELEPGTTEPPSPAFVISPDTATSVDRSTPRIIPMAMATMDIVFVLSPNRNSYRLEGRYGLARLSWDRDLGTRKGLVWA